MSLAAQEVYGEIWFEAGAMQGQFLHYADENVPLLAFHGDISIPEKWRSAQRLAAWWLQDIKPGEKLLVIYQSGRGGEFIHPVTKVENLVKAA
ncbi:unnamed protein product [marine sediment metagenome]|uniref:Uncharacterized protein n=1 Tax=marine sediment metagenome TaxID=412755 RepID=X1PXH3_9ZZZZ